MKKVLAYLLAVMMVVLPGTSWAAVAIGTVTDSAATTGGHATLTISKTVPAGSNRLLVVASCEAGTGVNSFISSVKFNGTETFTEAKGAVSLTNNLVADLFYLVAPTVTTANVVITYQNNGTADDIMQAASVIDFTGVDQVSPIDATASNSNNSATASASITTVAANARIIDTVMATDGLTIGAGQTERFARAGGAFCSGSTVDGKVTPGAETMDWTLAAAPWTIATFSIKPAAAAAAGTGSRLLLGVGQ